MFGDRTGHLIVSDRNFHISGRYKVFRGDVKGLAYLYDPTSLNKQYIVVLGDDAAPQTDSSGSKPPPLYFVKVSCNKLPALCHCAQLIVQLIVSFTCSNFHSYCTADLRGVGLCAPATRP